VRRLTERRPRYLAEQHLARHSHSNGTSSMAPPVGFRGTSHF
jgi:hypothetical protein